MDLPSWPCTELQGWKQKLGVIERFRLASLTAFELWAASSRVWGLGMCRQCKMPLGQHSVLGLLHPWQSAIAVPNLNPGLGLHELCSSAAHQVHRAGFHIGGQWEKATGKLCASDHQHTFRGLLLYIYLIFPTFHNVFSSVTVFYHTPTLHCLIS